MIFLFADALREIHCTQIRKKLWEFKIKDISHWNILFPEIIWKTKCFTWFSICISYFVTESTTELRKNYPSDVHMVDDKGLVYKRLLRWSNNGMQSLRTYLSLTWMQWQLSKENTKKIFMPESSSNSTKTLIAFSLLYHSRVNKEPNKMRILLAYIRKDVV